VNSVVRENVAAIATLVSSFVVDSVVRERGCDCNSGKSLFAPTDLLGKWLNWFYLHMTMYTRGPVNEE
jgi:hypothetical protein